MLDTKSLNTYHLNPDFEYYPATVAKKAIILVIHGLNVRPDAMLPIIDWLNGQGCDACLVKLAGHHENSIPLHEVNLAAWEVSIRKGYDYAKNIATKNTLPLVFLGYSLGALLGQVMISKADKPLVFDRQILLAPATALRRRANLVRFFFFLNNWTLPSFTPTAYRANNRLPVSIYKLIFEMNGELRRNRCYKLNIPTLIFIDPKDELISYSQLSRLCIRYALSRHELVQLDSKMIAGERLYHHLIISEKVAGKKNWELMTRKMQCFIFTR